MKTNNILLIIAMIAFTLIAYEVSPLIHETINVLIAGINPFDTIADHLKID